MDFQDNGDQESPDIKYPGRFITGGPLEARADSYAIFWKLCTYLHGGMHGEVDWDWTDI